jgi:hypothetical protein
MPAALTPLMANAAWAGCIRNSAMVRPRGNREKRSQPFTGFSGLKFDVAGEGNADTGKLVRRPIVPVIGAGAFHLLHRG